MKNVRNTTRQKLILGGALVLIIFVAVGLYLVLARDKKTAVIPSGSYLEQARELSKGDKEACLPDNPQAAAAVKADDTMISGGGDTEYSNFEMTPSIGIIDVPAGTNYDLTINNYEGGIVTGSMTYEKDYGTYNYTVKKLAGAGEWEHISLVACE